MRRLCIIAVLVTVAAGLAACGLTGSGLPESDPDITGVITSLTAGAGTVTVLVEAPTTEPLAGGYDKASVTIREDTGVYDASGKKIAAEQLRQGQRVRAWFTGAVAESYPVQATALALQVLRAE